MLGNELYEDDEPDDDDFDYLDKQADQKVSLVKWISFVLKMIN